MYGLNEVLLGHFFINHIHNALYIMSNFTLSFYFEEKLKVKNTCIKTESEKKHFKILGLAYY